MDECFTINETEVMLCFSNAAFKGIFTEECFLFPHENIYQGNHRKRLVFEDISGKKVLACHVTPQDRSFRIALEGGYMLLFIMYGRNGNILLFKDNDVEELLRTRFEKHAELKASPFLSAEEPGHDDFISASTADGALAAIRSLYRGMAKDMQQYLMAQGIETMASEQQWQKIQSLEQMLLSGPMDIYTETENGIKTAGITLLPPADGELVRSASDIFDALGTYAEKYYFTSYFYSLKKEALAQVQARIDKCGKQLKASQTHLHHLEHGMNYQKLADIIMANLHQIPKGPAVVTLYDFYQDKDIEVEVKRGISPQVQAEKLYRKAKNQVIETRKTRERIAQLEDEWLGLEEEKQNLLKLESMQELRGLKKTVKQESKKEQLPFHHFQYEGYDIYVGKNSANNDKLTIGFAHKEDMWLHAKGVSGSHVVIKHKQKGVFPRHVIEYAAGLAAYYSKAKSSILAPVIYTPKKYVRKPKGAAPGAVVVDKEELVIVAPKKD